MKRDEHHGQYLAHLNNGVQRRRQEARVLRTRIFVSYIFLAKYLADTYHSPPFLLVSPSLTLLNLNSAPSTNITGHELSSAQTAGGRIQRRHKQRRVDGCYETRGEYSIFICERFIYESCSHSSHSAHPLIPTSTAMDK